MKFFSLLLQLLFAVLILSQVTTEARYVINSTRNCHRYATVTYQLKPQNKTNPGRFIRMMMGVKGRGGNPRPTPSPPTGKDPGEVH